MQILMQAVRGAHVLAIILAGAALSVAMGLLGMFGVSRAPVVRWWHRRVLAALNVRVTLSGESIDSLPDAALLVCNHVSWLDIPVIGAQIDTHFVSKAEVRRWPLIGWMAAVAGTEFHQRGGGGTRKLISKLVCRLEDGQTVVVFPEGTTTDGTGVRRFQPRLFAAAIEAGVPVHPLVLRFGPDGAGATTCPYIGDDMFVPHLLRLLSLRTITVTLTVLPALEAPLEDRGSAARAAQSAVALVIAENPPQVDPDRAPIVFGNRASDL